MTRSKVLFQSMLVAACAFVLVSCSSLPFVSSTQGQRDYRLQGTYVEGFNCQDPNPYIHNQYSNGCQDLGVITLTGGKFMNVELKDAKIAYASETGKWVRVYVDAVNPVQREAAILFAREYLTPFGTIDTAREARIAINGENGNYTATVDNGSIMQLSIKPVIGGDNNHALMYGNTKNRISPNLYQGQTISGTFADGGKKIDLRDANAVFNNNLDSKGTL